MGQIYKVPKIYLIGFLNSIDFRAVNQKSEKHIALLKEFKEWHITHLTSDESQATMTEKEND